MANKRPKVSICIPTYNQAEFLPLAIRSALDQRYEDLEIVISDNHSTDATADYLARIADRRVRVVKPPIHLPMAANWDFCVQHSQGVLFTLLSSDDILLPHYTRTMVEVMIRFPNAAFSHCKARLIDAQGKSIGVKPLKRMNLYQDSLTGLRHMLFQPGFVLSTMMVRRDAYNTVGGFGSWRFVGDWDIALRLLTVGGVAYCDDTMAYYRVWSDQDRDKRGLLHLREITYLYQTTIPAILHQYPKLRPSYRKASRKLALAWALQLRERVSLSDLDKATNLVLQIDDSWWVRTALKLQYTNVLSRLIGEGIKYRWGLRQKANNVIRSVFGR